MGLYEGQFIMAMQALSTHVILADATMADYIAFYKRSPTNSAGHSDKIHRQVTGHPAPIARSREKRVPPVALSHFLSPSLSLHTLSLIPYSILVPVFLSLDVSKSRVQPREEREKRSRGEWLWGRLFRRLSAWHKTTVTVGEWALVRRGKNLIKHQRIACV